MPEPEVPCFECPDRTSDCHTYCQPYLSWVEAERKRREALRKDFKYMSYRSVKMKRTIRRKD